jgi:hypothetical protein
MNPPFPSDDACRQSHLPADKNPALDLEIHAALSGHPRGAAQQCKKENWRQRDHLWELFALTAPAEPDPTTWERLSQQIQASSQPRCAAMPGRPARALRRWIPTGIAASLVIGWILAAATGPRFYSQKFAALHDTGQQTSGVRASDSGPVSLQPTPRTSASSPAVLPIANPQEVTLQRLPALEQAWLPVGALLLETPMTLARSDEVVVTHILLAEPSFVAPSRLALQSQDAPMVIVPGR